MTILINNEQKVVPDGTTVSEVVYTILQLSPAGIAIAINDTIGDEIVEKVNATSHQLGVVSCTPPNRFERYDGSQVHGYEKVLT